MDTKNEDPDTYRFMLDCEKWYGKKIETITAIGEKFNSIQEVWIHYKSLNVANGAICSSTLKRDLRLKWQKENEGTYDHQVFGFDLDEPKRLKGMVLNHPNAKPIFPLWLYGYSKKDCINIIEKEGIKVPITYHYGFLNNNCFKTGCIQGGIGYWQKMKRDFPPKFESMAKMEHHLTDLKGEPVTMLKDQSKEGKASNCNLVFLLPHADYPDVKDISMMKGREPEPLFECNGMCSVNDLEPRSETEKDLNFHGELFPNQY